MSLSNDGVKFEPAQKVHLVAGTHERQGVFPAIVDAAGAGFVVLRLISGLESAALLTVGAQVHVADEAGNWGSARVKQVERAGGVVVTLEIPAAVAGMHGRGHQREYQRVTASGLFGYVSMVTARGATGFRVQILDLSASGASLMARRELQKNDAVHLRLPLLDADGPLELSGRIAWSTDVCGCWMAGLHFRRPSDAEGQKIQRFIFNLRWRGGSLVQGEAS